MTPLLGGTEIVPSGAETCPKRCRNLMISGGAAGGSLSTIQVAALDDYPIIIKINVRYGNSAVGLDEVDHVSDRQ
jgi:hypothetical protein